MYYIENEAFDVVCDASGNLLTDVELLRTFNTWRQAKAKEVNRSPYIILSNASIADLATRRPMTREDLLGIAGVGDKKVTDFGDELLRLIKSHS